MTLFLKLIFCQVWLPYNQDGSVHECKNKNGKKQEETIQNQEVKNQDISLELVLKKLESIEIIINVERLMKQE